MDFRFHLKQHQAMESFWLCSRLELEVCRVECRRAKSRPILCQAQETFNLRNNPFRLPGEVPGGCMASWTLINALWPRAYEAAEGSCQRGRIVSELRRCPIVASRIVTGM